MLDNEYFEKLQLANPGLVALLDKIQVPKKAESAPSKDIQAQKEKELNDWIKDHGKVPSDNSSDPFEKIMGVRYKKIHKIESDDDILKSERLQSLLDQLPSNESIYDFSNSVLKKKADFKSKPKQNIFVSKRTPAKNFKEYAPLLDQVLKELDEKKRKLVPFTTVGMEIGKFYIMGGQLCLLDEIYDKYRTSSGKPDMRLHLIFANGTESYMLYTTFQTNMSAENGRIVTELDVDDTSDFQLDSQDIETGYIYILRSASSDDTVTQFGKELYKVGWTSTTVEERIRNAVNEPTYLCSPVVIMEKWRCQNINSRSLETFLHKFFAADQKKIQVYHKGTTHIATEWYNVPLNVLEKTVPLIINGNIRNFRYDPVNKDIVRID